MNEIENEIVAKGPRITTVGIEACIKSEHFINAGDACLGVVANVSDRDNPLDLLTICVLVLQNGFTVTGESACVSPENFNQDIGMFIARKNAVEKIWALEGYVLKSKLAGLVSPM